MFEVPQEMAVVRGSKGGALGGLLPNWQSFGVDSYAQYMAAVSEGWFGG